MLVVQEAAGPQNPITGTHDLIQTAEVACLRKTRDIRHPGTRLTKRGLWTTEILKKSNRPTPSPFLLRENPE